MATVLQPFDPIAGVPQAIQFAGQQFQQSRQRQQQQVLQQRLREQGLLQQQQQQQAQQQLGGQFGLSLPPGLNPQIANLLISNAQQAALRPPTAQPGFTLSPGQQRFGAGGQQIAGVAPEPEPAKPRAGALQVAEAGDPSGFATGTVFQADPQGNIKILSEPGGGGLSRKNIVDLSVSQSDKFLKDKRVADFQEVERGARGIIKAFDRAIVSGKKGPSDQALGVLFQKMLDPGSVVRQSEFARTKEGQGVLDQMAGGIEKIFKGGLGITDAERRELMNVAKLLLNESKRTFNQTFTEFATRADEIGLNKKIVFGGAKLFEIADQAAPDAAGLTGALRQGASRFGLPTPRGGRQGAVQTELQRIDAEIAELEALR